MVLDHTLVAVLVFIGAAFGATLAALLPYYKKLREEQALGNKITFDPIFLKTLFMGFVVGCIASVMSFDANFAAVDSNANAVKIFVTAFITAAGGNVVINSFIKPSSVVTQLAEVKKQQQTKASLDSIEEELNNSSLPSSASSQQPVKED